MMGAKGVFSLGSLTSTPVAFASQLVAPATFASLEHLGWASLVGVVEIDPALSDTRSCQVAYGLPPTGLANCVVVAGKREGAERLAACVVLATTRADVNGTARRHLDVRKASFVPLERAVELTGMEYGAINPIGLPDQWPVLVDGRVVETPVVLIGSGLRRSKLLLPGSLLAKLPNAEVIDGLGL
jgi:prolyl-tRNA editing enzyme YbaK/EbsC (Cys-tRNA(Pro) deacylase)